MVASKIQSNAALVGVIDYCNQCDHLLALASPTPADPCDTWICESCGSLYIASAVQEQSRATRGARRAPFRKVMNAIHGQSRVRKAMVRPQDVQKVVACLARDPYVGREKRSQKRHRVAAPVTVTAVDPEFRIAADPIRTVMSSVSAGGAAVVLDTSVVAPFLLLDFAPCGADLAPALLRVTRVQQLRASFEVAGAFLSRIDPQSSAL
jgi:hypothetical protein